MQHKNTNHLSIYNAINANERMWAEMVHFATHFEKNHGAKLMLNWLTENGIKVTADNIKFSIAGIRAAMRGW